MAKVLNIEVGDRVTKICVSEKNKKGYSISNSFLMQTPVGAVRDGQIIAIDVMSLAPVIGQSVWVGLSLSL